MPHLTHPESRDPTCILLVDDNKDFVQIATEFLRRQGELTLVGAAGEADEALAQIQALQPHVILVDLDTPNLAGLKAIPRLRAILPRVAIIALALSGGSAYRQAALAAGADDLVSKAALVTDLLPAIQRVARVTGH